MTRNMLLKLMSVTDDVWDEYLFQNDLMYGKLTAEQKHDFAVRAKEVAEQAVASLTGIKESSSIRSFLAEKGICIEESTDTDSLSTATFALFTEPNLITLFPEKYARARETISQNALADLTIGWDFEQLALAHELFHLYEAEHPDVFTLQKVLCVWKIGKFRNLSRVSALREIAARHFVRNFLSLSCHPCVIELFLLYTQDRAMGQTLYHSIFAYIERVKTT